MRLSRRNVLALGACAAAARVARAQPDRRTMRIGVVLPERTGRPLVQGDDWGIAAAAARKGAVLAGDEYGLNAQLLGADLKVLLASAPDTEAVIRAARRLTETDNVQAVIGGFGEVEAKALAGICAEREVPFLNIGSSADSLRGEDCGRFTFHVEASDAMYLDAITAWFVRAGLRRWFFVYPDTERGHALYRRAKHALKSRHWGGVEAGHAVVPANQPQFDEAIGRIARSEAQVVMLLLPWIGQLDFLAHFEHANLATAVMGLPDPVSQTREFFVTAREAAPKAGAGRRAVLWEATLDSYGARELNERFQHRWGVPMDGPAWAAYQAVKILFDAATRAEAFDGRAISEYMTRPDTVFDVHKGIGVSFRPWDHQLRQSLYLVKVDPTAEQGRAVAKIEGEMPAIYMPGTDPVERLDQLGDLEAASVCRM